MFGFIYAIGIAGASIISGTKAIFEEIGSVQRGFKRKEMGENPYNVYFDRHGAMRDLATREYVKPERDKITGDLYIRNDLPSDRSRNLSKEWRDLYYEIQKQNKSNHTVCPDINIKRNVHKEMNSDCIGNKLPWSNTYYAEDQWYRDLSSGNYYVCRNVKGIDFYMDIYSGKLVRITDRQKKWNEENPKYAKTEDEIRKIQYEYNCKKANGSWNTYNYRQDSEQYWNEFYLNNKIADDDLDYLRDIYEMMGNVRPVHYR